MDNQELQDIAALRPDIVEELLAQLEAAREEIRMPGDVESLQSEDIESMKRLETLGYVGPAEPTPSAAPK